MPNKFSSNRKNEKSLLEIFHILYRGKWVIIFCVFLFLVLALLYSLLSTPTYESKALLKKEVADRGQRDELYEIVRLQTSDRLETEMELIKTNEVLRRVINNLKLYIELKEIIDPNGKSYKLKNVLIDFPESGNNLTHEIHFTLPIFNNFKLKDTQRELLLSIEKKADGLFELKEGNTGEIILIAGEESSDSINVRNLENADFSNDSASKRMGAFFETDFANFEFSWDDAPAGSKIFFEVKNYSKFLIRFSNDINVRRVGHTDVFELSVMSSSPLVSKIIADDIIHHFRELRMEQQKQTVRYSFNFIDNQLTEVQKKLKDAENNLSGFKGSTQIINVDQNTQELLNYMSTLEAEQLQTALLLSNYKDKAASMRKELESSGFFDQSFLEPSGELVAGQSSFSVLMNRLSELELRKLELLQKRTESHPDVISVDEQISLIKEQLKSYNQNTLTSYNIIINSLESKLSKILHLLDEYESEFRELPDKEIQMARLIREKDVYEKMFTLLLDKREEMRVAELSQLQDIIIVDPPSIPFKPVKPRKLLNMIIGLFLGGFIGVISVFLIELKNSRRANLDSLEEEMMLPILALIPKYDRGIVKKIIKPSKIEERFAALRGDSLGIRESYRLLETKLQQLNIRDKIFLVTSCEENSGKTSVVANLALTIAQNNKNVLIIDADLRKANLSRMFDVFENSPGLIDFINNGGTPSIYNKVLKQLSIIPAGGLSENSGVLMSSDRMKSLFNSFDTSIYEYIIIDTPPVTRVVDTLALGQFIKNAILVVRPDISIKETVLGGIQELNHARIKIRGIVGNAVDIQKSYHYKYRYGYGYGYSKGGNGKSPVIKKRGSSIRKAVKINSN